MGAHEQTGVAGCFSLDEYDRDVIKKHERTRRDKEDDRTRHIVQLRAQTGVVFLTYRASRDVDRARSGGRPPATPLYDFTAADDVHHTIWRAGAGQTKALVDAFARIPALYIADGHHRAASAARARTRAGRPRPAGAGEAATFIAVAFPDNQMQILPYNRTVKDLAGATAAQFLAALRQRVPVTDGHGDAGGRQGEVSMYLEPAVVHARPGRRHAGGRLARRQPRRRAAAERRARADAPHRRHPHRQAHRLRRRRPRHAGARAGGRFAARRRSRSRCSR